MIQFTLRWKAVFEVVCFGLGHTWMSVVSIHPLLGAGGRSCSRCRRFEQWSGHHEIRELHPMASEAVWVDDGLKPEPVFRVKAW